MNILIPDRWLRHYLNTKATPEQIKEYLSLCGPSVERIYGEGDETVYDMEITGNRPDAMSVMGVAREAATILPRFGVEAKLTGDPYHIKERHKEFTGPLKLKIKTDSGLNPRWTSVIFDSLTVKPSPEWLTRFLELAGMRSLNNVIDITNFLMHAYGQPAHVFDYDRIANHTMELRESRKKEKLVTLDGKQHTLPGGDIVIEDGSGKLIDLCGIMGGKNSAVQDDTKRVVLFLQTYDAAHIRKTSMQLGHRTAAAGLFEKGLDTELVKPVFMEGVHMMEELTGGRVASQLTDIYPSPYKAARVSVAISKIHAYIGHINVPSMKEILKTLGFGVTITRETLTVTVPSFRRDVTIDVDVIEEIARVYGYHVIEAKLPDHAPPVTLPDAQLDTEEKIKIRLRDWGFTECITYSMVSEEIMNIFGKQDADAYKIANPLSGEWVYMRPDLLMSMLPVIRENLKLKPDLKLFELSMRYVFRKQNLPLESPTLIVAWTGHKFLEAKGIAESLFALFGIPFPMDLAGEHIPGYGNTFLSLAEFGSLGEADDALLTRMGINSPITILVVDTGVLTARSNPVKIYTPVPKYPPVVEDLAFTVPDRFQVGPLIDTLKNAHPLVYNVTLLDVHKNTRTFHITYQDPKRNLTGDEIIPVRNKLIEEAMKQCKVSLKTL